MSGPGGFRGRGRGGFGGGDRGERTGEKSVGGPMNASAEEAEAHAKVSKRENRLYVGNLAYDCNFKDLEKFMQGGALEIPLDGCWNWLLGGCLDRVPGSGMVGMVGSGS
jgi:hypothetical protein